MTEPTLRDWADALDAMASATRQTSTLAEKLTVLPAAFELPRFYSEQLDSEIRQLRTSLDTLEHAASKVKAKGAYPDFEPTSNPGEMLEPCGTSCPYSGKWGATGRMPTGHGWQWKEPSHKSGYLGHLPGNRELSTAARVVPKWLDADEIADALLAIPAGKAGGVPNRAIAEEVARNILYFLPGGPGYRRTRTVSSRSGLTPGGSCREDLALVRELASNYQNNLLSATTAMDAIVAALLDEKPA